MMVVTSERGLISPDRLKKANAAMTELWGRDLTLLDYHIQPEIVSSILCPELIGVHVKDIALPDLVDAAIKGLNEANRTKEPRWFTWETRSIPTCFVVLTPHALGTLAETRAVPLEIDEAVLKFVGGLL